MARPRFSMRNIFNSSGPDGSLGAESLMEDDPYDPSVPPSDPGPPNNDEPPIDLGPYDPSIPGDVGDPLPTDDPISTPPVYPDGPDVPQELPPEAPVEPLEVGNSLDGESAAITPGSFSLPGSSSFKPFQHFERAARNRPNVTDGGIATPDFQEDRLRRRLRGRR